MIKSQSNWREAHALSLPDKLANWLTDRGSLTVRLQQTSQQQFQVKMMQSSWQKPLTDEALKLKQPLYQKAYCREVVLSDGNTPRVYARTVVPRSSYHDLQAHLQIRELGNRSLGEILFSDPTIKRGALEVTRIVAGQHLFEIIKQSGIDMDDNEVLWARRSCFYLAESYLLVCEIFLPGLDWQT